MEDSGSGKDSGKDSGEDSGEDSGKSSGEDSGENSGKDSGEDLIFQNFSAAELLFPDPRRGSGSGVRGLWRFCVTLYDSASRSYDISRSRDPERSEDSIKK